MMANRDTDMPAVTDSRARSLSVEVDPGETPWTVLGELDLEAVVREIAAAIAVHAKLPAISTTATLVLGCDAEVRALNDTWRGQNKPTNVLSFPSAPVPGANPVRPCFLGDVIIARETLAREAAEQGIAPADHFRHLALHGLLHLLGYDHETDTQAHEMETLETRILASIGVSDPYAGTEPIGALPSPATATGRS